MTCFLAALGLIFIGIPLLLTVGLWGPKLWRGITSIPVRKIIPSKRLRGSPEDLDPKMIALNLVITKMLRDIDTVDFSHDTLSYETRDVQLKVTTKGYFYGDWRRGLTLSLKVNGNTILLSNTHELNPKVWDLLESVINLKRKRVEQRKKERENEIALKAIEFLTLGEKEKDNG